MRNTKNTVATILILLVSNLCISNSILADVAVIVNPANEISSLDISKIKKLFLRKRKQFPNGNNATPIQQAAGSDVRQIFNDKVLKKSASQLKAYWAKIIFSGKGSAPKSVASDNAVKAFVAATKGAIGYIDSTSVDTSVKVVLTIK